MNKPLNSKLKKMIADSIHNDVMQAIAAKGKTFYDMKPGELDKLFETIAFNIKEKLAGHFKGLPPDILKGHFEAVDNSMEDVKQRLKKEASR